MHNKSKFDFHLVIKRLADEFEGSYFKGLRENTDSLVSFPVKTDKNVREINNNKKKAGRASDKTIIKYKMKLTDSSKFFQHFRKNFMKKCDEFRHKCKNCKHAHIKKFEEKEMYIIIKKCMHNCDCIKIVMSYVKKI